MILVVLRESHSVRGQSVTFLMTEAMFSFKQYVWNAYIDRREYSSMWNDCRISDHPVRSTNISSIIEILLYDSQLQFIKDKS